MTEHLDSQSQMIKANGRTLYLPRVLLLSSEPYLFIRDTQKSRVLRVEPFVFLILGKTHELQEQRFLKEIPIPLGGWLSARNAKTL
mmetsp:Transcript_11913/g.17230  ORF Transcript_11913/g.17230 Transcript_11913/m.17230 type:complete len:86 (-) Transcript_11913:1614-1871(-)